MKNVTKKRGFTLIEILLVSALMGTLFVMMFGTFFQINEIVSFQTSASDRATSALNSLNTLAADFNNLVTDNWYNKEATYDIARPYFLVKKNIDSGKRFDFASFISGQYYSNNMALQSRVHTVTYYVKEDETNQKKTLFRRESVFADYKNPHSGISLPLIEEIEEFKIEFSVNGDNWVDDWDYDEKKSFPKYIQVTIKWEQNNTIRQLSRIILPPILWL